MTLDHTHYLVHGFIVGSMPPSTPRHRQLLALEEDQLRDGLDDQFGRHVLVDHVVKLPQDPHAIQSTDDSFVNVSVESVDALIMDSPMARYGGEHVVTNQR